MSATDAAAGSSPLPDPPVRESAQGTWFRLPDGFPGSRVRLPVGAEAATVRRLRRLGLPGLLPVAAVLEHDGRIWVDTPLPPGPTVDDLLDGVGGSAWARGTRPRCSARSGGRCGRCTRAAWATGRSTRPPS